MPGLLVSVAALGVVFYLVKPKQLLEALKLADFRYILLALLASLLWLVVRTQAWRTLLRERAAFGQVFFTVCEGYLINNVLPFRLGEVARSFILSYKSKLGFWEVFSTIFIERLLDLAFAVGVLLVTLPFVIGAGWAKEAAVVSGLIVTLGLASLYLLGRYHETAQKWFEKFSVRWPKFQGAVAPRLAQFLSSLVVLTDLKRTLRAVFWIGLNWTIALAQYYLFMIAFFPDGKPLWAAFALGAAALGIAAPSSPGGVGVFELVLVGAYALFGVPNATALAIALTAHLTQYLVVGLLGTIGLAMDGFSLASVYQRSQQPVPGDKPQAF